MKRIIIQFISCLIYLAGWSQERDTTSVAGKPTTFIAGITYHSALNYYGRTDSLKSQGLYPFLGLQFSNGFYVNSSFVFVRNKISTEYAAAIVEAGYQFKNRMNSCMATLFVNSFFYRNNSNLVQSAIKGTTGVIVAVLNNFVNVNLGGDVKLSDKLDYGASLGLDKTFRIEKVGKGLLVIDPAAYINAGTQNFTETYYRQKNFLLLPAGEEQITTTSKSFTILSCEYSIPVVYALRKMTIIVTPAYVVPQHLIVVPNRPDLSERGEKLLYFSTTLRVAF